MQLEQLINALRIVEVRAESRRDAIAALIDAVDWQQHDIDRDEVLRAVEGRESVAQTVIAEGLALPHATVDWDGDFVAVLGRSRDGVDYGAGGERVHLLVLLVVGTQSPSRHLELLATTAQLLEDRSFRQSLMDAEGVRQIKERLRKRAGMAPDEPAVEAAPSISSTVAAHAVNLAREVQSQALLVIVDRKASVPWEQIEPWKGRLLVVTAIESPEQIDRPDTYYFNLSHTQLPRNDRASLGLLLAAADGLIDHRSDVVCITGPEGSRLDCVTVTKPPVWFSDMLSVQQKQAKSRISPTVILRVITLGIEIATEGREGQPLGALFVIGDRRRIADHTRQLVLNPFHGFSPQLRNVLDPSLAETIKEFAMLDGAFVVDTDGAAVSAGTYVLPTTAAGELPGGLGTRHQAAASITEATRAIAVVVSQSTGAVTVFQAGNIVLKLQHGRLNRWWT